MTTFATDGFLSTEISEFERTIAGRYAKKLALAVDTNRLAHRVIYSIKPHREDAIELLLAALLTRQISAFQSIVILLRNGLETQTQVLLRNLAEMMFVTGAIRKDETFAKRYVLAERVDRLKALEAIVRDKRSRQEEIDADTARLIRELRGEVDRDRPETFTTYRIAEIAGLLSYYDNLYRYASMAVHASPRELNAVFVVDADGNVVALRYEPVVDDLDMYFDYGISMMLYMRTQATSGSNWWATSSNCSRSTSSLPGLLRKATLSPQIVHRDETSRAASGLSRGADQRGVGPSGGALSVPARVSR